MRVSLAAVRALLRGKDHGTCAAMRLILIVGVLALGGGIGRRALVGWAAPLLSPPFGRVAVSRQAKAAGRATLVDLPARELRHALPELHKLHVARDQRPLAGLLAKVGANVSAFFQTFPNVAADETVHEDRLGHEASQDAVLTQSFWYFAEAWSRRQPSILKEFRTDRSGRPLKLEGLGEGFVLTTGFISLPVVFASAYQPESRFRYLGRERVGMLETEVVAFAQRLSAHPVQSARVGGKPFDVLLQGVAWIDPAKDQIVRFLSELLRPLPRAGLSREKTVIQYAPKRFKNLAAPLWLPRKVVVSGMIGQLIFSNVHAYTNQRLFNVETRQRTPPPVVKLERRNSAAHPGRCAKPQVHLPSGILCLTAGREGGVGYIQANH